MSADLRDWPGPLRLSAAIETLAQAIYEARATRWCLAELPLWFALSERLKQPYRDEALATLERVKPQARGLPPVVTTGLRVISGGRLLGAIEPQKGDA